MLREAPLWPESSAAFTRPASPSSWDVAFLTFSEKPAVFQMISCMRCFELLFADR